MKLILLTSFFESIVILVSSNGKLMASLCGKYTDFHQYLHYNSSHPEHTKQSIICCQTLRVGRACSQESEFKEYSSKLQWWVVKRGYSKNKSWHWNEELEKFPQNQQLFSTD